MSEGKKKTTEAGIWHLPEDLMINILVRLPPRYIGRCRCICRSWYTLLINSFFLSLHLKRLTETSPPNLLFFSPNNKKLYATEFNYDANCVTLRKCKSPCAMIEGPISVIGSCNGLLCVLHYKAIVSVSNPLTRECFKLPHISVGLPPGENGYQQMVSIGFGYDPDTRNFKVVRIASNMKECPIVTKVSAVEVMVYTIGSSAWRRVEDVPIRLCYLKNHSEATYVNGALYWVALHCDENQTSRFLTNQTSRFVTSFVLKNEAFEEISLPKKVAGRGKGKSLSLGVLQGSLSAFHNVPERCSIDIWLMNDYGKESCWTWLFSIKTESCYSLKPLFFKNNGELLVLVKEKRLFSYDPERQVLCESSLDKWVQFKFKEEGGTPLINAFPYMGTLASEVSLRNFGTMPPGTK